MNGQPLVVGYGSAGKRHVRALVTRGYTPCTVDINDEVEATFSDLEDALHEKWSFAIIATPPEYHVEQMKAFLDMNIPVLCEKPVAGFGQMDILKELTTHKNANQVLVSYNYRYNPDIDLTKVAYHYSGLLAKQSPIAEVSLFASQKRDLPYWGIILDHLSHDVNLLQSLFGEMSIETARHITTDSKTMCIAHGVFLNGIPFTIKDEARKNPSERIARIQVNGYTFHMTPNARMFDRMYDCFFAMLNGDFTGPTSLDDAIKTQEVLEEIKRLASA